MWKNLKMLKDAAPRGAANLKSKFSFGKGTIAGLILSSTIGVITEIASPLVIQNAVKPIENDEKQDDLQAVYYFAGFCGLLLISALGHSIRKCIATRTIASAETGLVDTADSHILALPADEAKEYLPQLTDIRYSVESFLNNIFIAFPSLIGIGMLGVVMQYEYESPYSLPLLASGVSAQILFFKLAEKCLRIKDSLQESEEKYLEFQTDINRISERGNILLVQQDGRRLWSHSRIKNSSIIAAQTYVSNEQKQAIALFLQGISKVVAISSVLWIAYFSVLKKEITLDHFAFIADCVRNIYNSNSNLLEFYKEFGPASEKLAKLRKILGLKTEDARWDEACKKVGFKPSGDIKLDYTPAIRFKDVKYKFSFDKHKSKPIILQIDDLTIPAHKITVLVGKSGKGKSTLIDLLFGRGINFEGDIFFVNPQNYEKTTDENRKIHLRELTIDCLRGFLALVPQSPGALLPFDNIKQNILPIYAKEIDITQAKIDSILNKIIYDLLLERKAQEKTINYFSGGEKQRVAIARAIAKIIISGAKILVLDEPTSALDRMMQDLVLRTFKELKHDVTIIMVTHSVEVIEQHADKIVFLSDLSETDEACYVGVKAESKLRNDLQLSPKDDSKQLLTRAAQKHFNANLVQNPHQDLLAQSKEYAKFITKPPQHEDNKVLDQDEKESNATPPQNQPHQHYQTNDPDDEKFDQAMVDPDDASETLADRQRVQLITFNPRNESPLPNQSTLKSIFDWFRGGPLHERLHPPINLSAPHPSRSDRYGYPSYGGAVTKTEAEVDLNPNINIVVEQPSSSVTPIKPSLQPK